MSTFPGNSSDSYLKIASRFGYRMSRGLKRTRYFYTSLSPGPVHLETTVSKLVRRKSRLPELRHRREKAPRRFRHRTVGRRRVPTRPPLNSRRDTSINAIRTRYIPATNVYYASSWFDVFLVQMFSEYLVLKNQNIN